MRKLLITVAAALCLSPAAFAEESSIKDVAPGKDVPSIDTPAPVTPAPTTPTLPKAEDTTPVTPAPKVDKADIAPKDVHEEKGKDRHGSSWKMGPNKYGFQGNFGHCHYTGYAGPHGYHIDKAC
jgi:hypothetical protein